MSNAGGIQEKLNLGIEAARRGDREAARLLLRQVVSADPKNEAGWMWLATVVDNLAERRSCLQNALRLNPNNQRARDALNRLEGGGAPRREAAVTSGGRGNTGLIIGILFVVAVLALVVFIVVNVIGGAGVQPVTSATAEAVINPTITLTPDPASFTATPFFGVIVTRAPEDNYLPPTFTPTFTPVPSATPTPTATPYPLTSFNMILTGLMPNQAEPALYAAAGDGSSVRPLGDGILEAVYDPSGQSIAFVRAVSTTSGEGDEAVTTTSAELFVGPADNPNAARQITTLNSRIAGVSWAPDGIRLAFGSDTDGDFEIFTITEDGNNLRQITVNDDVIDRDPAWSPDGNTIVFASDRESPGITRVYSMSVLGEDVTLLTRGGGGSYAPRWSPNGRLIVYLNDGNGDADIYTMEPDGQGALLLTAGDGSAEDRSPVFTPDGRLVAFASNRESDVFQVYTVDLRGAQVTRLTQDERDYQALDYQPNPLLRLTQN